MCDETAEPESRVTLGYQPAADRFVLGVGPAPDIDIAVAVLLSWLESFA
jgi:hypothetical protein